MAGVAVVAVAIVTGCTSGSSSDAQPGAVAPGTMAADESPTVAGGRDGSGAGQSASGEAPTAAGDAAAQAPADQSSTVPIDTSKVIKTADLSVRLVVDPVAATSDAAADREANTAARSAAVAQATANARAIAAAAGGFQANADGGGSQMAIGLRVPADQYDPVVDKLAAIGEVTSRTESSQDVTAEVIDVNSRVESMTASVARVRALLAQATNIADVIAIESELSVRESNLEALQQQQAYLSGQVAMSTISLTLTAVTDTPASDPAAQDNGFVAGIKAGWAALLGFFGWIGGAVGAVLPFLPFIAAAIVLGWWLIRRLRRRIRPVPTVPPPATAPSATAPPATGPHQPGSQAAAGQETRQEPAAAGLGSG